MDLSKYTSTELLKMSNDIKAEHDAIKQNVIDDLRTVDEIQHKINENLQKLEDLKNLNTIVVEELNKR
jgi:hypothetical protein